MIVFVVENGQIHIFFSYDTQLLYQYRFCYKSSFSFNIIIDIVGIVFKVCHEAEINQTYFWLEEQKYTKIHQI